LGWFVLFSNPFAKVKNEDGRNRSGKYELADDALHISTRNVMVAIHLKTNGHFTVSRVH
jgi:hypothetical protein